MFSICIDVEGLISSIWRIFYYFFLAFPDTITSFLYGKSLY